MLRLVLLRARRLLAGRGDDLLRLPALVGDAPEATADFADPIVFEMFLIGRIGAGGETEGTSALLTRLRLESLPYAEACVASATFWKSCGATEP